MGWDKVVDLARVLQPIVVAVVVALLVSGRDDRRQRRAERQSVQRETIIALQDGWLEMDERLTNVLSLIQSNQSDTRRFEEERQAEFDALERGELPETFRQPFEERWKQVEARSEELYQSGEEMSRAVIDLRRFAKRIELLESRISAGSVKATSKVMREYVEAMIWDVGSYGGQKYQAIRTDQFAPAFDRFVNAGYEVLADIDHAEGLGEQLRQALIWPQKRSRRDSECKTKEDGTPRGTTTAEENLEAEQG